MIVYVDCTQVLLLVQSNYFKKDEEKVALLIHTLLTRLQLCMLPIMQLSVMYITAMSIKMRQLRALILRFINRRSIIIYINPDLSVQAFLG